MRDPIASNATADGRARNRRVEIIIQSAVVQQTVDNAGLDNTPTTTPKPVASKEHPGVTTSITPPGSDIVPHLGAG